MDLKNTNFLEIPVIETDIRQKKRKDGTIILKSAVKLKKHPYRMTERLGYWAKKTPNKVFIAQKCKNIKREEVINDMNFISPSFDDGFVWQTLTYYETYEKVKNIAQYLLTTDVSVERPIVILSENSIEHALIALAALHIGMPHSPLAPAYSLRSSDYAKLRYVIDLLTPGLIFVQDYAMYEKAIQATAPHIEVLDAQKLYDISKIPTTNAVDKAFDAITPETIAKILFTSGSTGLPKRRN